MHQPFDPLTGTRFKPSECFQESMTRPKYPLTQTPSLNLIQRLKKRGKCNPRALVQTSSNGMLDPMVHARLLHSTDYSSCAVPEQPLNPSFTAEECETVSICRQRSLLFLLWNFSSNSYSLSPNFRFDLLIPCRSSIGSRRRPHVRDGGGRGVPYVQQGASHRPCPIEAVMWVSIWVARFCLDEVLPFV